MGTPCLLHPSGHKTREIERCLAQRDEKRESEKESRKKEEEKQERAGAFIQILEGFTGRQE